MTIDKNSTDQELMQAYDAGNAAGKGFEPVGEPTDTPLEAAGKEGYTVLREIMGGTNNIGEPVFCEDGDDLIVIANEHGPWAVKVGTLTPVLAIRCDDDRNGLVYNWPVIDAAALAHGIDSTVLRDFAFDGVTEQLTGEGLALAYLSYLEAKEGNENG